MKAMQIRDEAVPSADGHTAERTARETIVTEIAGLNALLAGIDARFARVVEMVAACSGRVIVTGVGKSGHIGQKIAATLASTGTPAFFVHAAEAAHGDLGMIGSSDLVIAISNSGESSELTAILEYCRRFRVPLVAMTSRAKSTLGRYADALLLLPDAPEACPLALAPMTSTTLALVMGDALAAALIRVRNFQRDDFAKFHPAGKLGAQLLRLSNVLERQPGLQNVPKVESGSEIADVIAIITEGRRGATAVADASGHVIGVITDGDLRRALADRAFFQKKAIDVMTADPRRIASDRLAVEALAMCEEFKVSALFITDAEDEICGMVHLQDLLTLGIV